MSENGATSKAAFAAMAERESRVPDFLAREDVQEAIEALADIRGVPREEAQQSLVDKYLGL